MVKDKVLCSVLTAALSAGAYFGIPALLGGILPFCTVQKAEAAATAWNFKTGLDGWKYGGKYAYQGKPNIVQDSAFGGSLRIDVDYTAHAKDGWSEIKIENGAVNTKALALTGKNVVMFDFYYNPKLMTSGSFKTKLYAKSTTGQEVVNVYPDIDLSKAKEAGNGIKVVRVKIPFLAVDAKASYFCLSVVGSNTDYKGPLYINHLSLGYEKVPDGYIEKVAVAKNKAKLEETKLNIPAEIGLVDPQATHKTVQTAAFLRGVAASEYVLYGHQNEMHKKVSSLPGKSDTYDAVKDYAAIVGVDGLALTGNELSLSEAEKAAGMTLTDKLARISLDASRNGSILTMSCHMPNFAEVAKRAKVDGHYDYTGYSPNVTSGNVVKRILPGGDLNEIYNGYLDMVAAYDVKLQAADVPVLFRPFHENNGSWFWWGAAFCTPSQYKNLYHYTVEYLRDKKGLHNLLYVYSPGGPFTDEADYLTRYPGDAYIDIVGFDMYHRDPVKGDDWMQSFDDTLNIVQSFAAHHDKLAAVTEVGVLVGKSAMAKTGNQRLDWFNETLKKVSPHAMAYFMTWSNFDESNFDQPYMVTAKRGHEMINYFIDFYNQPQAVFAGQMPDYSHLVVQSKAALGSYGYLTAPNSLARVCEPTRITAKTGGKTAKAQFLLKKKDGTTVAVLDATNLDDGPMAEITAENLADLGPTVGSIELQLNGKAADSLPVLFNMPQPPVNPAMVDDFESYYGDNGLLKAAYSTNCGGGCEVTPILTTETGQYQSGSNGLVFHYKINKGGYAGIVKSLGGVDWSKYKAVQFWVTPDGKGQKLIIQLNSNGEDFEVDLSALAKESKPQLVTLPFTQFVGKNNGKFDKAHVQHFAIYCNTIGDAAMNSTMYFDDIKAVE